MAEVAALRTRVFVEEQGVPPEIEQDAADATAVHVLSRDDAGRGRGHRAGCSSAGATAGIGRMAADRVGARAAATAPPSSRSCTARRSCAA